MFRGVYTALITPFHQGSVDEDGLRLLIQRQIEAGVHGIVVLGTTGETPTLTQEEQEKIIRCAVEEAKGRLPILVGTGSYATQQAIFQTKRAKELGADGALVITPYYNRPTQEGLFLHFLALSQACAFPLIIYNVPSRTGVTLTAKTLLRIAELPHVVALKDASPTLDLIEEVLPCNIPLDLLTGDDKSLLPVLALGGHGVFSVASNLFPKEMVALFTAWQNGNTALARQWHYRLLPFFKASFLETNPIPIKAAMELAGLPAGPCRLPLCCMEDKHQEALKQVLGQLEMATWQATL